MKRVILIPPCVVPSIPSLWAAAEVLACLQAQDSITICPRSVAVNSSPPHSDILQQRHQGASLKIRGSSEHHTAPRVVIAPFSQDGFAASEAAGSPKTGMISVSPAPWANMPPRTRAVVVLELFSQADSQLPGLWSNLSKGWANMGPLPPRQTGGKAHGLLPLPNQLFE